MNIPVKMTDSKPTAVDFQFVHPKKMSLEEIVEELRTLDSKDFRAVVSTAWKVRKADDKYSRAIAAVEGR